MVYANLNLRGMASAFLQKYQWVPLVATLASGFGLTAALLIHAGLLLELGGAAVVVLTSYSWGYSARALRQIRWPPLSHLARRQYADVWDSLAASPREATGATAGGGSEQEVHNLLELVSVGAQDDVLEIGCGIGRLGLDLASHCRHWTGADISIKMLAHASDRLRRLSNVGLVHLPSVGLGGLPANAFDVVYSINVFAHLDEIDRWRYVQDASRVLRSGGRLYIENIDLESEEGWMMFVNHAKQWESLERPPYDTTFSTAAELMAYVSRAGFQQLHSYHRTPKVIVTGIKPGRNTQ
jgi:ubiquinone/menaquinone biosynthesis C-methylase UbiE